MLITPPNLNAMFTAYSLMYQQGYTSAEIFWRSIAMLVPSATETMSYAWMEKIPRLRKWLGPRVVQNVVARGPRVVVNDPYELTIEIPKHKIQDDTYGIYAPLATDMGAQAAKWPDDVVAEKFLENPVSFDGKAFFATDHPVNLDVSSAGTYSNLEASAFPLTPANYGRVRAKMRAYKGADGRYIGAKGTLLVVPPSLEEAALMIVNGDFYPSLVTGATLGQGDVGTRANIWKSSAEVLVIDQLEDAPTTWYVLDTSKAIKPMVFQLREAPVFTYLTNPADGNVFWNKMFVMGCEARGAADVSLPFLAHKAVG